MSKNTNEANSDGKKTWRWTGAFSPQSKTCFEAAGESLGYPKPFTQIKFGRTCFL